MIKKKLAPPLGRKRRKKSKMYFGSETHNAIIEYQKEELLENRSQIYCDRIRPAFEKLSENLIFIHGFSKISENYETLKHDCVAFLYESINKFDASRGTKSFSYFNVVAKNWLIINSKKATKAKIRHVSIEDFDYLKPIDKFTIENYQTAPSQDDVMIKKEMSNNILTTMAEIKRRVNNKNEISCIDAIITLFNKIDDLDFLNKRAVFVYMRDISNLTPKQLSVAMSVIRKHYKEITKSDNFRIF